MEQEKNSNQPTTTVVDTTPITEGFQQTIIKTEAPVDIAIGRVENIKMENPVNIPTEVDSYGGETIEV